MAISWFASLKDVHWEKVLTVAPSIVEMGKKIWNKLADAGVDIPESQIPAINPVALAAPSSSEAIAALEDRVHGLERRAAHLTRESVAAFDVVRAMAAQHSEVVHAVGVLLVRTRVLVRVCVLLGVALLALFVLILSK